MLTALIMAGGEGTRFWPLSSKDKPKQFLNLNSEQSMLEDTFDRISDFIPAEHIFIATNKKYKKKVELLLTKIPSTNIIVEPAKKNTAPAIGLASMIINTRFPGSTTVVLPADHYISDQKTFVEIIKRAVMAASWQEKLITLGIKPERPETGFGYIKCGKKVDTIESKPLFEVLKFTEKPDFQTAKYFLESDSYLWNSGIFIWKLSSILNKIEKHLPDLYNSLLKVKKALGSKREKQVIQNEYRKMEAISIDFGILEKTNDILVIPASFNWDDIGSWTALEKIKTKDKNGNIKAANHFGIDTNDSIIYSDTKKLITTLGIDNLILVETEKAILVCNKDRAQEVKKLRNLLAEKKLDDYL